jgi:CBS domain-containing protein
MVTKFDVLRVFAFTEQAMVPPYAKLATLTASEIMSRDVITVAPDAPLTRVLQNMVELRMRSLPVVDGTRLLGIIAREDIVRALRNAFTREATLAR